MDFHTEYLGDGLYVEFDGWMLTLKANSRSEPTDVVHLEPAVLNALMKFIEKIKDGQ